MRLTIALALLLATGLAFGADTYRFPKGVVSVGDSAGTVLQKAGDPSRITVIENGFGARMGERWEYYLHGKTVIMILRGGIVESIEDVR